MLFDHADIPRQHISANNISAPPTKRPRFQPLRRGKLVLATIALDTDQDGQPKCRKTSFSTSVGLKVLIASGQQQGRWFFDRFVLSGHKPSIQRTRENIRRILECHGIDDRRASLVHGLTVPIRIEQQPHWQTGKIENCLVALSPVPGNETIDEYHQLVSKLGEIVPGWQLYPDSKSYALIMKRRADLVPGQDGLSALDRRRRLSCHDRVYARLGASMPAGQDEDRA